MADTMAPAARSALMARIKAEGNKLERTFAGALRLAGVAAVRNDRGLPGTPDFSVLAAHLAVFVHGCFWHGCPRHYRAPRSRRAFWRAKLRANRARDARAVAELARIGWRTATVWECDLLRDPAACASAVARMAGVRRA